MEITFCGTSEVYQEPHVQYYIGSKFPRNTEERPFGGGGGGHSSWQGKLNCPFVYYFIY